MKGLPVLVAVAGALPLAAIALRIYVGSSPQYYSPKGDARIPYRIIGPFRLEG